MPKTLTTTQWAAGSMTTPEGYIDAQDPQALKEAFFALVDTGRVQFKGNKIWWDKGFGESEILRSATYRLKPEKPKYYGLTEDGLAEQPEDPTEAWHKPYILKYHKGAWYGRLRESEDWVELCDAFEV